MQEVRKWLTENSIVTFFAWDKITNSLILIFVLFLLHKIISKILEKRTHKIEKAYEWKRIAKYILGSLGVLIFLRIWFQGVQSLITFLGILSAGIAISLKDFIANMVGWLFIISRNPFNVGDRIQIGEISGDVVDIRMFQFTLLEIGNWVHSDQSTGRLIHIPNARVLQEPQANYTQSFKYIWNEISTTITFESNHKKASKILDKILNQVTIPLTEGAEKEFEEAKKRFLIIHGTIMPKVYWKVAPDGVELFMRYLVPARKRRDSEHSIWTEVLNSFNKAKDIEFAYPTTRFYKRNETK